MFSNFFRWAVWFWSWWWCHVWDYFWMVFEIIYVMSSSCFMWFKMWFVDLWFMNRITVLCGNVVWFRVQMTMINKNEFFDHDLYIERARDGLSDYGHSAEKFISLFGVYSTCWQYLRALTLELMIKKVHRYVWWWTLSYSAFKFFFNLNKIYGLLLSKA